MENAKKPKYLENKVQHFPTVKKFINCTIKHFKSVKNFKINQWKWVLQVEKTESAK